ncbi:hypothetical protein B0H15DRAFT_205554 [Mycena belliarum]|uniref:Uncharacterized protein n=1 Tax=Mycena belliarum TaxID=1033014 RepID=A0AAD6ULP5_9AGAR|nr:hypothetical protein B0H15DRAFT_205554 [Mycena belliae]
MAAAYFNGEAEPFEESQGNRAPKASPDELKAFYRDMERSDLERKLSKRKSTSLWSRKSLRRTSTSQSHQPPAPAAARQLTSPSTSSLARGPPRAGDDRDERSDSVPPMPQSRSIIPGLLKELPAWYTDHTQHPVRFTMHNPVGPRWYKNQHLVPPGNSRPATRPPSVFSPSFPAMASTGGLDRLEESSRMAALNRSASNSPLPTPNSSQSRMDDAGNVPRSRKTSQTAHDTVDLLDGTDPWGTAWHHESPYDVGLSSSPAAFEEPPPHPARSRASSVTTAQNRRKTVTPSPLSQSTSAVHLQVPEGSQQLPRKLSKRRTVGIFGRSTPTSPADEVDSRGPSPALLTVPRQGPPSSFVSITSSKKERRGSILGRIAKRFSITRKPTVVAMEVTRQPSPVKRQPSPEKPYTSDLTKRVPPPLVNQESSFVVVPAQPEAAKAEADRSSFVSLEADAGYTMGRLTVTNPDPGSVESTPVQRERRLSQETEKERTVGHERGVTDQTVSSNPTESHTLMQWPQSPESTVSAPRAPEPIVASISIPSQPPPERVQMTSRAASPPPPPAPEKSSENAANGNHFRGSFSGPRISVDGSTSPHHDTQSSSNPGRAQSSTTRYSLLDKPQPPPPSSPSPKLPAVPFPADYGATPAAPTRDLPHEPPQMTADISPLSVSSMLVNPPTPYKADVLMPDETESIPPPIPSKRSSRDPSPSQVAVTGRETETFRLIRSASGTVYASSETIRAAGEQWEVVESSKSRTKNKSQDRESDSRREQRRQARLDKDAESEQPRMRSERSHKRRSEEVNSQSFPRSDDHRRRPPIPDALVSHEEESEPKANRQKRDEERDRKSDRKRVDPKLNKPQPPPPTTSGRPLERNPSKSARPISEVNDADMNTMRAREAWDMDRLWKARSMSGMEPNGVAIAPVPPAPAPNGKRADEPLAFYGSSHTAFMVSTPFQQPSSSQIYHSMPPVPPPLVYPPGYSNSNVSTDTDRPLPFDHTPNPLSSRTRLANPLPEPPRESPYEPAPLNLPEYWSKHTSVTTAH